MLAAVPGKPKAPPPKTTYGKAATSLKVVTFGSEYWAPVIPDAQLDKEPNRPRPGKPTPSDHDCQPDPWRPPNPRLFHDDGRFAAASRLRTPTPPAQPARNRPAPENPWANPVVDNIPQPSSLKRAATSAPRDKKLPHHEQPPPADAWNRQDAARNKTHADVRQPATVNKNKATRAGLNKPRTNMPRLDKPRVDKPEAEQPRFDEHRVDEHRVEKPRIEKPRIEKPRVDMPWADKPRGDKPQVEKPLLNNPRTNTPRVDKPRVDKPRIEKPRIDMPRPDKLRIVEPRVDKSRAGKQQVDTPHGTSPLHVHEYETLTKYQ